MEPIAYTDPLLKAMLPKVTEYDLRSNRNGYLSDRQLAHLKDHLLLWAWVRMLMVPGVIIGVFGMASISVYFDPITLSSMRPSSVGQGAYIVVFMLFVLLITATLTSRLYQQVRKLRKDIAVQQIVTIHTRTRTLAGFEHDVEFMTQNENKMLARQRIPDDMLNIDIQNHQYVFYCTPFSETIVGGERIT